MIYTLNIINLRANYILATMHIKNPSNHQHNHNIILKYQIYKGITNGIDMHW
jgi:hypothetical protein